MTKAEIERMTPEEKNKAIAAACGKPLFTLMKRGLFYRPNGCGYTSHEAFAWKLPEEEADKHTYPHDIRVTKHPASVPNYCASLDACHEMENTLSAEQCWLYNSVLSELQGTAGGMGTGFPDEWSWHATAAQKVDAFLLSSVAAEKPEGMP